jgi:hypothetical protein
MKRLASSSSVLNLFSARSPAMMTRSGFRVFISCIAVVSLSRRNCSVSVQCRSDI